MSYNQVAIYKYGGHAQAAQANDSMIVRRQYPPHSRTLQLYRPMSSGPSTSPGNYENMNAQFTREQIREFRRRRLEKERTLALADILGGIARDPEQEEYEEYLRNYQAQGAERSSTQEAPVPSDVQYKSAQIHNPTNGHVEEVTVIEDSGCRVNFVHPRIARLCNLTICSVPPIQHSTLTGIFTSDQAAEVTWLGQNGNYGTDWFYIAPENAPIELQVLVGTQFLNGHQDTFQNRALLEPALLNVQTKLKASR
ncbi:uncharacterized protein PAC_08465 [Phialocephala subalpina]|uniref:Uncharacterized protein n=1 Tax=Phialocephala subalpina TaxID=576137 RepID=A0A1L7X0M1_9HELO|nr:uncharacterized protein PAC_08465 [Phialocephala subalpina]